MEKVRIFSQLERVVAHSDEVEGILGDHAYDIFVQARTGLARHQKTGEHRITQTKGKVDHYVNLVGPAALSLEEGHLVSGFYKGPGAAEWKFVDGLHILRDAMKGAVR